MSVCVNSQFYSFDDSSPKATPQYEEEIKQEYSVLKARAKTFKIPNIVKRLNKIELNIRELTDQTVKNSRQKRQRYEMSFATMQMSNNSIDDGQRLKKHSKSLFISEIEEPNRRQISKSVERRSCLGEKDSVARFETINNLEENYANLKSKIMVTKVRLPRLCRSGQQELCMVTGDDIDRDLKRSVVQEGGKKQFGDIHIIRKGRDRMTSSLSMVGECQMGASISPYQNLISQIRLQRSEMSQMRQQVGRRIKNDRDLKKNKMLSNRYMHGNVYNDMLSLSKRQKNNLKKFCRFPISYGINK